MHLAVAVAVVPEKITFSGSLRVRSTSSVRDLRRTTQRGGSQKLLDRCSDDDDELMLNVLRCHLTY